MRENGRINVGYFKNRRTDNMRDKCGIFTLDMRVRLKKLRELKGLDKRMKKT